jgi:hypothetical protein
MENQLRQKFWSIPSSFHRCEQDVKVAIIPVLLWFFQQDGFWLQFFMDEFSLLVPRPNIVQ